MATNPTSTRIVRTRRGAVVITRFVGPSGAGRLVLTGVTGVHRVTVDERTDAEAHIAGFIEANGGLASD